jgi:hypothetical protein
MGRWLILAGLSFLALGLLSVPVVLKAEEQDAFCASCHTEPETTYLQRTRALPVDLASFHADKDVQCILCHSMPGLVGRLSALPTAAWDAARFVARTYHQPARLSEPLHDSTCVQCHAEALQERGFPNHFHSELLAKKGPISVICAGCHAGHVTVSDVDPFLARATVEVQCNACHRERGEGPSEFRLRSTPYAPAVRRHN